MRLALAGFAHETVTFLPDETPVEAFERGARRGQAIAATYRGSATVAGGFIAACEAAGVTLEGLVHAEAAPSGPVAEAAYERYAEEICDGLERCGDRIDGLLLHLHGAMATKTRQDPESDLLRQIRERIGGALPIALALDLHGNLAPGMHELVDVLCGYHESPHIDMDRTGARAAGLLIRKLQGEIRPVIAVRKPGLVLPSVFTATALSPLNEIMAAARTWEAEARVLDVSVFTGFAYADVRDIGFSTVAVADGDEVLAGRVAVDLARRIEQAREALFRRDLLLAFPDAVERALALAATSNRPVVILEHADRMNDSTWVLGELARRDATRVAVPYLWDPVAVRVAMSAGAGGQVVLAVGGRSSSRAGEPVVLTGTVRWAGPKSYLGTGPMRRGVPVELGDAAVIEAGGITVIVTSNQLSAIDTDPFLQFGLRPEDFDIIVLRSKTHFRAVYEPLAEAIVIAETPDWGAGDLARLPYRNVPPGVFPITA